jgi:broad specificity phosphatase PhoE
VTERTIVHLLRHGEVHNPEKILYGRLPGYHLSEVGRKMADRAAEYFAARDVAAVIASPLERAQETAAPVAAAHGLPVGTDERIIESTSVFEGRAFGPDLKALKHPRAWRHLHNPFRPSWGEAYAIVAIRMHAAASAARDAVRGREAVLVSHQLPIWIARLAGEHRRLWHDPRRRECSLASVTSLTYEGDHLVSVDYSEPAADLLPIADTEERGA